MALNFVRLFWFAVHRLLARSVGRSFVHLPTLYLFETCTVFGFGFTRVVPI